MTARHRSQLTTTKGEPCYEIGKVYRDGEFRHIVTIHCAKCHRTEEMLWSNGNNPDNIKRRALSMNWLFDPFSAKACICPNCHKRGGVRAVAQTQPPAPNVVELKQEPPLVRPPQEYVGGVQARDLTPDEKSRVRYLLDHHFDDSKGHYINQYSDKRIGEELHIPWLAVQKLREGAYGPIKQDARVIAIQGEMASLRSEVSDMRDTYAAMAHLIKRSENWQNRFAALEAKVKDL